MCMANMDRHGPNTNYIPLTCVGARIESVRLHVGLVILRFVSTKLFGHQHVDIGTQKSGFEGIAQPKCPTRKGLERKLNYIKIDTKGTIFGESRHELSAVIMSCMN